MGRTSLRLQERITQHISKSVRNKKIQQKFCLDETPQNQMECDLANGLHLLQNPDCAAHYHDRQFSIMAKARTLFHLADLEAIFVKTQQPNLSRQKEFVCSLQIKIIRVMYFFFFRWKFRRLKKL